MDHTKDRTWAEISLGNLLHNYEAIRKRLPVGCRFLGTVKANAYGHGALRVAHMLQAAGADYLAVACMEEAVPLRQSGITLPVLVFGYSDPARTEDLIALDLTQAIYSADLARAYSEKGGRGRLKAHLKLDTGMGRLGFDPDGLSEILSVLRLPGLDFEGVFTHFAASDEWGSLYTDEQFRVFQGAVSDLEAAWGRTFSIHHCANSGAVINHPATFWDMVRPGIALYGAYESPTPALEAFDFRPGMSLKTRIVQIREFSAGRTVGYGRTFRAETPRQIAVLPIGYADGLLRALSGRMDVLIGGQRAPQVGRICMDMCMVDITNIPGACVGDVVTIFGDDGGARLSVSEQAAAAGTISYELLCAVSGRVPRTDEVS